MFFENEFIGSLPLGRLLLMLLLGLSPVAVTILVKLMLYERRAAENEAAPARETLGPLVIEGTLEEFAVALANGIAKFREPHRLSQSLVRRAHRRPKVRQPREPSKFGSYCVADWR